MTTRARRIRCLFFCPVLLLCLASPIAAQPGTCTEIPGVTAAWQPGSTPPPAWQGADPATLLDDVTTDAWFYYWEPGPAIPVVFTLPAGWDVTSVAWHDHFGDGTVTLTAAGNPSLVFSTDLWPLAWHDEAWNLSGVTTIEMTTSSNNTKIAELAFCGTQGTVDTTPPAVVQGLAATTTCSSIDLSWTASQDFDDNGNTNGFADHYLVSWNGGSPTQVTGTSTTIPAAQTTTYTIDVVAVDASGNQSAAASITETTPACPPTGGCTTIQGVTAAWPAGSTPPPAWQAAAPSVLVDGFVTGEWFYYWSPGTAVPVIFELPAPTDITAVRWHDHYGDGSLILEANGQTKTIPTDRWPLDWHVDDWTVTGVSTVELTTSSNNTKITELTFCGTSGPIDTTPPDPVDDLAGTVTGCTSADFTWTAPADIDGNGNTGTASSYRIGSNANPATTVTTTSATLGNLNPDATNTISIVAIDTAGNESTTHSITVVTPPCTGGLDAHPGTAHIVDSFGEVVAPNTSGHPWHGIDAYYAAYYADGTHDWHNDGMCSKDVHNRYWVLADENGQPAGSADYDGDGDYESYYPTWHPPVHDPGGPEECWFMHEHGEDPRTSPLYDRGDAVSIGIPFGYVHSKMGNMNGRMEDHVGHKVVVENDYTLVDGNPFGPGTTINEIGINCNWLSKIHQGSHSSDALGNNLHEYFLNVECDDTPQTSLRTKELVTWGYPNKVYNEGSTNCSAGITWFWAGFDAASPVHSPDQSGPGDDQHVPAGAVIGPFEDGKREIGCHADRHGAFYSAGTHAGQPQLLSDLWKPDSVISAPGGGGTVIYSPYYITRNPPRYVDPNWTTRFDAYVHDTYLGYACDGGDTNGLSGDDCQTHQDCVDQLSSRHDGCTGTGAMVSSVDLCVRGSDAWTLSMLAIEPAYATNGQYPGFCTLLDPALRTTWEQEITAAGGDTFALSEARKYHADNPFDGTMRGVHTKTIQMYAGGSTTANYQGFKVFCTDAFGAGSTWPTMTGGEPICPTDTLLQAISPFNNSWGSSAGSNANAFFPDGTPQNPNIDNETGLVGGGEGAEFVIDGVTDPANKVRPPN